MSCDFHHALFIIGVYKMVSSGEFYEGQFKDGKPHGQVRGAIRVFTPIRRDYDRSLEN